MSDQRDQYSLREHIIALQAMSQRTQDGLKLLRLIGPELNPDYNDQVGVAKCQTLETMIAETNRASKSLTASAKVASFVRNESVLAWNGEEIDCRPQRLQDRPVTVWCVGLQLSHIGQTMFRLLFEDGAFQIIDDPDTGAPRPFQPWREWDARNAEFAYPGPPLIPPSVIKADSWVWESKGARQVAAVELKNGSRIYFYPSTGDVKKGDPVHLIWIDEMIRYSDHYAEWVARLTDYEGFLLWSTMVYPQVPAIMRVMERAEIQQEEVERGDRRLEDVISTVFRFKPKGNPYLSMKRLEINREIYSSEGDDVVAQRLDGGDIFDNTLIYPFFKKQVHCAIPPHDKHSPDKSSWDDLAHVLHDLAGLPPKAWTHEMIIDPGAQKPAVLFCAVPPRLWTDAKGKDRALWAGPQTPFYVPYDEIYGRRYSLQELVPLIVEKMRGIRFRRFIMDMQGGRVTSMVGGPQPHQLYSIEFERAGIESAETGFGFIAGGQDFSGRKRVVESWMQMQSSGWTPLRIVVERCPNLVQQMQRNQLATQGDVVLDKPARRERNDLRVALEYWASRSPKYVHVDQTRPMSDRHELLGDWLGKFFGRHEEHKQTHFGPGTV